MLPVKKIVTTTDFSELSLVGIQAAAELAQTFGAVLILVHVIHPLQTVSGAAALAGYHLSKTDKERTDEVSTRAKKLLREKIPETIRKDIRILHGEPDEEIVKLAKKESVELVVIASKGESGWKKAIFGSVAEKVIKNAECPVLVVPPPRADI